MESPTLPRIVRKLKRRSTSPIQMDEKFVDKCPASPISSRFDDELAKIIDYSDFSDTDDSQPDSGEYLTLGKCYASLWCLLGQLLKLEL